jgi:NAD+ kinase
MSSYIPWGGNAHLPDIVVVQKKTALERYAADFNTETGRSYFLKDGQSDDTLQSAHDQHCQTLDSLLTSLTQQGLSFSLHTLDDLAQSPGGGPAHFQAGREPGLRSRLDLVICVGGDGTLLRTSHFVGGNTRIVGVNSVPKHSVGHLCALNPADVEQKLADIISEKRKPKTVRRLVARTNLGLQLPYALNDIYFGHQHPASASRYTITIEGPEHRTEKQVSSGLWLATPAGSTAAIHSYGLGALDVGSDRFLLAVREPYAQPSHHLSMTKLLLDGNTQTVTLFSRMRHGIVCVDGPVTACVLGFGESLEVGLQGEGGLKIFLN